jgi:hypothetical protein
VTERSALPIAHADGFDDMLDEIDAAVGDALGPAQGVAASTRHKTVTARRSDGLTPTNSQRPRGRDEAVRVG